MTDLNIAGYGQGSIMYPPNLSPNLAAIRTAGWNTIILGFLHIDEVGNIRFSDTDIVKNERYVGDPEWPGQLSCLLDKTQGSTITELLAGVGGADTDDFAHIQAIYQRNNRFKGTLLQKNFQVFHDTFKTVTTIEMDDEITYDRLSFFAFCQMLAGMDLGITFCPYCQAEIDFWVSSLKALNKSRSDGPVKWWDLQCYAGGGSNKPQDWADAIAAAIPGFDTTGFILVSDWSRFLAKQGQNPNDWCWNGDCPSAMFDKLSTKRFRGQPCVGGAFVWTVGSILTYAKEQINKPDPHPCGNVGMSDYIAAVKRALS